ncbi:MAG: hypothetical protein JXR05_17425, partial [Flavobacteriaceae bacterium]
GHSLLGTHIINDVKKSLGIELNLGDLFSESSVRKLVGFIENRKILK